MCRCHWWIAGRCEYCGVVKPTRLLESWQPVEQALIETTEEALSDGLALALLKMAQRAERRAKRLARKRAMYGR